MNEEVRFERLWTVRQLADFLQVPVATIYGWRYEGIGPRGLRVGKHLRYRPADLYAWLNEQAA